VIPRVVTITPSVPPANLVDRLEQLARCGVDRVVLRFAEPVDYEALTPATLPLSVRPRSHDDALRALEAGLDLHLPASWDPAEWRRAAVLGQSCHSLTALQAAARAGADYAFLSPVFRPVSKPDDRRSPLGLEGLRHACTHARLPVLALGGITTAAQAAACRAVGARGVAGISAFFGPDPVPDRMGG
jgi:thiamine-phosphate pyrophosphorylase